MSRGVGINLFKKRLLLEILNKTDWIVNIPIADKDEYVALQRSLKGGAAERIIFNPSQKNSDFDFCLERYESDVLCGRIKIHDVPQIIRRQSSSIWHHAFRYARNQYKCNIVGAREYYQSILELLKNDAAKAPEQEKDIYQHLYDRHSDMEDYLNAVSLLDAETLPDDWDPDLA